MVLAQDLEGRKGHGFERRFGSLADVAPNANTATSHLGGLGR